MQMPPDGIQDAVSKRIQSALASNDHVRFFDGRYVRTTQHGDYVATYTDFADFMRQKWEAYDAWKVAFYASHPPASPEVQTEFDDLGGMEYVG